MKYLLISLLFIHSAYAAEISIHDSSLYLIILFLFLLMTTIYAFYMKKCEQKESIIEEKEEKIVWLRQIHAESEHRHLKQVQDTEKKIMTLHHTISDLERQLQEGTKNQVVSKIEALRKKRQNSSHI